MKITVIGKLEDQLSTASGDEEMRNRKDEVDDECYCEAQSDCCAWRSLIDGQVARAYALARRHVSQISMAW